MNNSDMPVWLRPPHRQKTHLKDSDLCINCTKVLLFCEGLTNFSIIKKHSGGIS